MRPLIPAPSERPCVRRPARGPSLCVERAKRTARGGLLGSGGGQSRGPRAATRPALGVSHARAGLCRLPPHGGSRWPPQRGGARLDGLPAGGCWTVLACAWKHCYAVAGRWVPAIGPLVGPAAWRLPPPSAAVRQRLFSRGPFTTAFLADKPFRGGGTISFFEAHPARTPPNPSVAACVDCVLWARRAHARARGGRKAKELSGGCSGRGNHQGTL